ncbi:glycosyltransferase [Subsaximicrobium wynnwilliamsii]|uniref:glycosyltransferase n=1 Tax=Subsaximicrobium wynnwilliamsii TaxID=291179 RepID=UPI0011BF8ACC|nr:glycosyltransferase [Subsaximicrobium wynnwilliamsii]TXE00754.1 glycosyltransferase [Subsaximicrobium wynnwilliamsii]
MKVSIITATYDSELTLPDCMASVLSQSHEDIEYVIIDGDSKDGTLGFIESKAKAHANIVYASEPDKGIYDALNKGIQMATGDVIGFVHSDDYLADPKVIENIVTAFEQHKADGVYGDLHYVSFEDPQKLIRNWKSQVGVSTFAVTNLSSPKTITLYYEKKFRQ